MEVSRSRYIDSNCGDIKDWTAIAIIDDEGLFKRLSRARGGLIRDMPDHYVLGEGVEIQSLSGDDLITLLSRLEDCVQLWSILMTYKLPFRQYVPSEEYFNYSVDRESIHKGEGYMRTDDIRKAHEDNLLGQRSVVRVGGISWVVVWNTLCSDLAEGTFSNALYLVPEEYLFTQGELALSG